MAIASQAYASYYAKKEISTGNYIERACALEAPDEQAGYVWEQIASPDDVELFKETVLVYDSNELISWAMQQLFSEALIPHFAAFLDFANKASNESKANFLAYAYAVGLEDTALLIIQKAQQLGANVD